MVIVLKKHIERKYYSHCVKMYIMHNYVFKLNRSFFVSSVKLCFLYVSSFILFISQILELKVSNLGFIKEYLCSFNFTIVTFIDALLRVKSTGLLK